MERMKCFGLQRFTLSLPGNVPSLLLFVSLSFRALDPRRYVADTPCRLPLYFLLHESLRNSAERGANARLNVTGSPFLSSHPVLRVPKEEEFSFLEHLCNPCLPSCILPRRISKRATMKILIILWISCLRIFIEFIFHRKYYTSIPIFLRDCTLGLKNHSSPIHSIKRVGDAESLWME